MSAALDLPSDPLQIVTLLVSGAGAVTSIDSKAIYLAQARLLFEAQQRRIIEVGIMLRAVEQELVRLVQSEASL